MNLNNWKDVIEFYKEHLGIPAHIVEFLASYDILHLCCTGISNETISEILDIDLDEIKNVVKEKLNFIGWYRDLDINPLFVYNSTNGNQELYTASVMAVQGAMDKIYVNKSFMICKKFEKIEKEINKYYG